MQIDTNIGSSHRTIGLASSRVLKVRIVCIAILRVGKAPDDGPRDDPYAIPGSLIGQELALELPVETSLEV